MFLLSQPKVYQYRYNIAMASTEPINKTKKWLHLAFGVLLLISFFLPWVLWKESRISGYDMPAGNFFSISESKFGLGNPFPQFNFTFYLFWLIPALTLLALIRVVLNKKTTLISAIAGVLTLTLVTVYFLFTKTLIDLGVGNNVFQMLQLPVYLAAVSAAGLILTALPNIHWLKKTVLLLLGPVFAFSGYKLGEKYIMAETFTSTDQVKADFTVTAQDLIREFAAGDSAANIKYSDKIVTVTGTPAQIEAKSDSTFNIKFTDTTRYYLVFSLEKNQYDKAKNIKEGDVVSLKGSCSGSIYSGILDSSSISFKRSTLNK